jgi:hypothetical protein
VVASLKIHFFVVASNFFLLDLFIHFLSFFGATHQNTA